MPIYEYECKDCGKRFDALQKFSDEALTQCKFCEGPVRKLLGTPALQFKGTGWYITDYAGKSPRPEGNKGGEDSGSGKSEGEKKEAPAKAEAASCSSCCPTASGGTKTES